MICSGVILLRPRKMLRAEGSASGPWTLTSLKASTDSASPAAEATVRLTHSDGRTVEKTAAGDGPVDASFKAIEAATGITVMLNNLMGR